MDIEVLKEELLKDERLRQSICECGAGNRTKAIDRNIGDTGVAMDEAIYMLDDDIRRVQRELDKFFPWWREMSGSQQRAVANLTFILGIGKLASSFHTLKYLKAGEYGLAADALLVSELARKDPHCARRLANLIREK